LFGHDPAFSCLPVRPRAHVAASSCPNKTPVPYKGPGAAVAVSKACDLRLDDRGLISDRGRGFLF
jgi:hypothetical protein